MRNLRRALTLGVAFLLVLVALPLPIVAADLTLSTDFPGVYVKPGQSVDFGLTVAADGLGSGSVDLTVLDLPKGWQAPTLRGGGFTVSQVWASSGKPGSVTLSVPVPDNATEGTYHLTVQASLSGAVSSLPLTLIVAKPKPTAVKLTTQYPSQEGAAGTTFKYQVTLDNGGDSKQLFTLAGKAPEGWQVIFHPGFDTKQIASLPVDGGSSQNIDVEIQTPEKVAAGKYPVQIAAGAGNASTTLDLQVSVTGKVSLSLATPDGRLNATATAGSESALPLTVTNTGSSPLSKVTFSADAPPNWQVTFKPEKLDALGPGQSQQVEAVIKPSDKAIAGDYVASLSASAGGASDSKDIRVAVQTSTLWGIFGALVVVAVIVGVYYVFRHYGRR